MYKKLAKRLFWIKAKRGSAVRRAVITERMRWLYPLGVPEKQAEAFELARIERMLKFATAAMALILLTGILGKTGGVLKENLYILRRPAGDGSIIAELYAHIDGERVPVQLYVSEQKLNTRQQEELFAQAQKELEQVIVGENESLDKVTSALYFPETLQNGMISVEWELDRYDILNPDGTIRQQEIEEQGELVRLTAIMKYEDRQCEVTLYAHIYEPVLTKKERLQQQISDMLQQTDETTRTKEKFRLPGKIQGQKVTWEEKAEHQEIKMALILVVVGGLYYYREEQVLKELCRKRKRQLKADYPQLVNQISLLLGAGMTLSGAWYKIIENYEKAEKGERRYLYEEMQVTGNQLKKGVSELQAYEAFGKRCGLRSYMKLSRLLTQNLKKGGRGLEQALDYEVYQAFEERKAAARQMGEEASTKMLLPMGLILAVVLTVVVVPGFLSF